MTITQNHQIIQQRIAEACGRVGRDPSDVRIVAVSKTVGPKQIEQAIAAGVYAFGENRAALFKERLEAFPQLAWHFIGTIQTNKVRDFAGRAALVHSVASERALRAINAHMSSLLSAARLSTARLTAMAATATRPSAQLASCPKQAVLIEVNVSGEKSKDGVCPSELEALLALAAEMEHITVNGLMTMAPMDNELAARTTFASLREIRNDLSQRIKEVTNIKLVELSMGMSQDYVIAVEEGATIVRIGRALWD